MKNLPIDTWSVRETTVEIQAADLRESAKGVDRLILRVVGLSSPNGRPISRSIRIPTSLLEQQSWE